MTSSPPIALLIFSNDLDHHLSNIEMERTAIYNALEHYNDTNRLKVIIHTSVDIHKFFELMNKYAGNIALIHFAGHADGKGLQFNDVHFNTEDALAKGLAAIIKREIEDGILETVFLNGCSTQPQVEALKEAGVKAILATRYPINDTKALHFATQFYRSWANADKPNPFERPTGIIKAFKTAAAFLQTTEKNVELIATNRGLKLKREKKADLPWLLNTQDDNLILPNEPFFTKEGETVIIKKVEQNAEKIYNIEHIDKADFS